GVRQLDAHPRRARLRAQFRIDEGHLALDRLRRISADGDGDASAELDRGQIALGHFGDHPEVGVVGDPIELLARFHSLTLDRSFLDDVAGGRGPPIERQGILARTDFADMALRDAVIAQALLGAADAQVDLGRHDVGAVYAKQWLPDVNMLAGLVDEQLFD